MLTDLQTRKFTRMFNAFDADHSGYLEFADVQTILTNLAQLNGIVAGSPEYEAAQSSFRTRWEHTRQFADTNRDDRVTLDEWLAYCSALIQSPEMFEQDMGSLISSNARLMDRDGDGLISLEDFAAVRGNLDSDNTAVFQRLDLNGDGYISREEFIASYRQFFLSDDPDAPGSWFFGPF